LGALLEVSHESSLWDSNPVATAPSLLSLEEYMATSYSPDREYIDGVLLERNVGRGKHSDTQTALAALLRELVRGKGLRARVEQRVKVAGGRVRIPDVCVIAAPEETVTIPPLLCVEVLSPDDRWSRTNASIRDYQAMGVPCIWIIDPYSGRAWIFDTENPPAEVQDGRLLARQLGIELPLADILPPIES
jgi:Uma2 family endonuclease